MKIFQELLGLAFLVWPLVLVVLILLAFVLAISVSVFVSGRTGFNKWAGAFVGFLVVYVPIFWDWIPTVMAHRYYCEKEAGFWIYKSVEQWKAENAGVIETLVEENTSPEGVSPSWPMERESNMSIAHINKRFGLIYKNHLTSDEESELFLHVWRWKYELYDKEAKEILARQVDFSSGTGLPRAETPIRFWLQGAHCSRSAEDFNKLYEFVREFRGVRK